MSRGSEAVALGDVIGAVLPQKSTRDGRGDARAVREEEQRRRANFERWREVQARIGARYADCTLDNFRLSDDEGERRKQESVIGRLRDYMGKIPGNIEAGTGIVLFGPMGTGKDHLLVELMREACRHGLLVTWQNGMDLFGNVRDAMDSKQSEADLLRDYYRPDVLVLSDPVPPWGDLSQFQAAFLFRLIDHRYRHCRPIWVTGNFADSKDAKSRLGAQLVDRLQDGALVLRCDWPSARKPVM